MDAPPGARALTRLALVAALFATIPGRAAAQRMLQPEFRVDVLGPAPASLEPGAGITTALGTYVRVGLAAGVDVLGIRGDARRGRAELVARATLDPYREQRFALSIGGGLGYRRAALHLVALLDVEGPAVGGVVPALQAGVGGGLRGGVILRRAIPGRR